jgi:hypothetical protein
MTSVSGSRPVQPSQAPQRGEPARDARPVQAQQQAGGAQAMRDALSQARGKVDTLTDQAGRWKGKGAPAKGGEAASAGAIRGQAEADARTVRHQAGSERQADGQGFGLAGQPAASPPVQLPAMPAAHVDPSAFAQTMADLWTRENGRGAKEVRVRFGSGAWPATGARLVRNPEGRLDIALTADRAGGAYDGRLNALRGHLAEAGLDIGALSVEDDEG